MPRIGNGLDQRMRQLGMLASGIPVSVLRDFVSAAGVQFLTIGSGLVLFHLIARRASVDGFAYYQVARGLIAALQPVTMIGLVPGLHRYLPRAGGKVQLLTHRAFVVQLTIIALVGALGLVLAGRVGHLLGIAGGARPVLAIIVALAGICLLAFAVAALRGSHQTGLANVTGLLGLGAVPIFAFLIVHGIGGFLVLQGVVMSAVAVCGVAAVGRNRLAGHADSTEPRSPGLKTLVNYGIRRTLGDIALPAIFSFPTFFVAAATHGGPEAGYIGFTTSAITLICSVFGMLTPVLLPKLSAHLARPVVAARLWSGLRALPIVAVFLAALAAGTLAIGGSMVVRNFLGNDFSDAVPILRMGLLASIPLAAFYAARPTLDALQDAPVTVRLMLGSLAVEVAITYLAMPFVVPTSAAVLGLIAAAGTLGALSFVALLRAVRTAEAKEASG